jgi:hypothetical protein
VRHCLIALVLFAVTSIAGAQPAAEASTIVESCAREAPPGTEGLEALQTACPGLKSALDALGLANVFADDSAGKLTPDSLGTLLALERSSRRSAPDTGALEAILRELHEAPAPQGAWARFKQWLQRLFDSGGATRLPWLQQWLERLTPGALVLKLAAYALMALVVVAAALIVVREIRASNLRFARRRHTAAAVSAVSEEPGTDRDALHRVPAAQRPRLLFRLAAARLAAAGRLPAARSLTHRELRARATFEGEEQATWAELARLAERQLYAHEGAAPADEPVLARAERLWL